MTRRRFTFWLGLGLFTLGEKLDAAALDRLAAAAMGKAEGAPPKSPPSSASDVAQHWRAASNGTWRWFERETLVDEKWTVTGITAPIHKETGERADSSQPRERGRPDYLADELVPQDVRFGLQPGDEQISAEQLAEFADHHASAARRARHGRPPSKWLRSLEADELHIWLRTIEAPEAEVSGMTFLEHLTRDHSFDAEKIAGLSPEDQAKLHAAAHFGY